jgi:hypothetical protein
LVARPLLERRQPRQLPAVDGDHDLAGPLDGHAVLGAEALHRRLARRLKRAFADPGG